jgi:TBC1 domain family member 15
MDLQSTLVRAEALFRRFQRTVEAIDKRNNFPAPSIRQRKPAPADDPQANGSQASASGSNAAPKANDAPSTTAESAPDTTRVITPELRKLLSRKVDTMDHKDVKKHGGGVGS